jgi:hypothetical protein
MRRSRSLEPGGATAGRLGLQHRPVERHPHQRPGTAEQLHRRRLCLGPRRHAPYEVTAERLRDPLQSASLPGISAQSLTLRETELLSRKSRLASARVSDRGPDYERRRAPSIATPRSITATRRRSSAAVYPWRVATHVVTRPCHKERATGRKFGDGETRTRTGDTTIFRESSQTLLRSKRLQMPTRCAVGAVRQHMWIRGVSGGLGLRRAVKFQKVAPALPHCAGPMICDGARQASRLEDSATLGSQTGAALHARSSRAPLR